MNIRTYINSFNLANYLFLLIVILNVIDFETTYIGITSFGAIEKNFIVAYLINWFGLTIGILGLKTLVLGHVYYQYFHTEKGKELFKLPRTTYILAALNVLFIAVVVNNLIVLYSRANI